MTKLLLILILISQVSQAQLIRKLFSESIGAAKKSNIRVSETDEAAQRFIKRIQTMDPADGRVGFDSTSLTTVVRSRQKFEMIQGGDGRRFQIQPATMAQTPRPTVTSFNLKVNMTISNLDSVLNGSTSEVAHLVKNLPERDLNSVNRVAERAIEQLRNQPLSQETRQSIQTTIKSFVKLVASPDTNVPQIENRLSRALQNLSDDPNSSSFASINRDIQRRLENYPTETNTTFLPTRQAVHVLLTENVPVSQLAVQRHLLAAGSRVKSHLASDNSLLAEYKIFVRIDSDRIDGSPESTRQFVRDIFDTTQENQKRLAAIKSNETLSLDLKEAQFEMSNKRPSISSVPGETQVVEVTAVGHIDDIMARVLTFLTPAHGAPVGSRQMPFENIGIVASSEADAYALKTVNIGRQTNFDTVGRKLVLMPIEITRTEIITTKSISPIRAAVQKAGGASR